MKSIFVFIVSIVASSMLYGQSVENGKSLFQGNCAVCHGIGKGKLIGPDLAGVAERREKEWIFSFINNSSEMIASGDETAVALFEEYNKMAMPPYDFSSDELEDLLAFIAETENEVSIAASVEPAQTMEANPQPLKAGINPPTWFLVSASIICMIIITLLVVIFKLLKMTRKFSRI